MKIQSHVPHFLSKNNKVVTVKKISTSLGPVLAGSADDGICLLEFIDGKISETQIKRLQKRLKSEFVEGTSEHIKNLEGQLKEFFAGKRKEFDLPLVFTGTDFQKKSWQALMKIPHGETRSYQEQARSVGNPKAVRAVARANGDNKISIVVPCHRVIGKNGKLTGYGGGLWRKKYLLDLERSSK